MAATFLRVATYPLGDDAVDQLLYADADRVSAQMVRANQSRFPSDDWRDASTEQMAKAWTGYFGYFGTIGIDEAMRDLPVDGGRLLGSTYRGLVDESTR